MIIDAIRRLFGGRTSSNPCEEALSRLQEFVDGELDDAARADVEAHFRACTDCSPHLSMEEEFRRRVQEALRRPRCPESLRSRITAMIEEEKASG
jgi:anti-sigma factor (TIGR02949 family)